MRHAVTVRHRPHASRVRMVGGAVVEDRRAAQHQAAIHQQRSHHPAHVGNPHHALTRPDVHPQCPVLRGLDREAGVTVDRPLWPAGRSRGIEEQQRFVRPHRLRRHRRPPRLVEVLPRHLAGIRRIGVDTRASDHHQPLQMRQSGGRFHGDRLHGDRPAAPDGGVRRDQHACLRVGQPLADRVRAEAREERHRDRAQLGTGEQGHRILDDQRQVEPDRDPTPDADLAEPGRDPFDRLIELRIGQLPRGSRLGLGDDGEAFGI